MNVQNWKKMRNRKREMTNYVNEQRMKRHEKHLRRKKNQIVCCSCFLIVQQSLLDTLL